MESYTRGIVRRTVDTSADLPFSGL